METSNADRVLFPDDGISKGEVVGYYELVADLMIGHMRGRPLTLQRFPKGIAAKGFMQKNAAPHFPASIRRLELPKKDGTTVYPVVDEPADIAYLANQGTITFHVWPSRVETLEHPDRIVFDLDPAEGDLAGVRSAALIVRRLFETLGLATIPVATGSKGYHVVAPIAPTVEAGRLANALQGAAALLAREHPELLTTAFRKDKRAGRVFLDWMRTNPGATSVCPWSLRPRPGAPVATPLTWEELESVAPDDIRLRSIGRRIEAGDPLADLAEQPTDATGSIEELERLLEDAGIAPEPFDRFRS